MFPLTPTWPFYEIKVGCPSIKAGRVSVCMPNQALGKVDELHRTQGSAVSNVKKRILRNKCRFVSNVLNGDQAMGPIQTGTFRKSKCSFGCERFSRRLGVIDTLERGLHDWLQITGHYSE